MSYDIGILVKENDNLQEVIDRIQSDKMPVIIINRVHTLRDTLKISDAIKFIGQSRNSILKLATNGNCNYAIWINGDNCTIKDITIEGFTAGIKLKADNCTIENTVIDSDSTALDVSRSNHTRLINNIFLGDPISRGILFSMENCFFAEIRNNTFEDCRSSVKLKGVNSSKIEQNSMKYLYEGIKMDNCIDTSLSNNSVYRSIGCPNNAFSIKINKGCKDIKVENNTIEGNVCDDNINNMWYKNCWINEACSQSSSWCIRGCLSQQETTWDRDPRCCVGSIKYEI